MVYYLNFLSHQKYCENLDNELLVARREGEGREFGMDMFTLLYLKWITKKDLLYSTWNSAQYYVAAWIGGKFEYIYMYD